MEKQNNVWFLIESFDQLSEHGRIHLRNYLEELLLLQTLILPQESSSSLKEAKDGNMDEGGVRER